MLIANDFLHVQIDIAFVIVNCLALFCEVMTPQDDKNMAHKSC